MVTLTLLLAVWLAASPVQAKEPAPKTGQCLGSGLVQRLPEGQIDWGSGLIQAKGVAEGGGLATPESLQLAVKNAQDALARLLRGMVLTPGKTVGVSLSPAAGAELANIVRGAQVVERKFYSDGSVEVWAALCMRGGFLQLVLPPGVTSIAPLRQVNGAAARQGGHYSGLVVDARGLGVRPALCPRLLAEDGSEVFGPTLAGREAAVQGGVAAYATVLPEPGGSGRAGGTPLVVRGLRTAGPSRSDIVISRSDAQRVRSAPESVEFLQHCRVLIVLD